MKMYIVLLSMFSLCGPSYGATSQNFSRFLKAPKVRQLGYVGLGALAGFGIYKLGMRVGQGKFRGSKSPQVLETIKTETVGLMPELRLTGKQSKALKNQETRTVDLMPESQVADLQLTREPQKLEIQQSERISYEQPDSKKILGKKLSLEKFSVDIPSRKKPNLEIQQSEQISIASESSKSSRKEMAFWDAWTDRDEYMKKNFMDHLNSHHLYEPAYRLWLHIDEAAKKEFLKGLTSDWIIGNLKRSLGEDKLKGFDDNNGSLAKKMKQADEFIDSLKNNFPPNIEDIDFARSSKEIADKNVKVLKGIWEKTPTYMYSQLWDEAREQQEEKYPKKSMYMALIWSSMPNNVREKFWKQLTEKEQVAAVIILERGGAWWENWQNWQKILLDPQKMQRSFKTISYVSINEKNNAIVKEAFTKFIDKQIIKLDKLLKLPEIQSEDFKNVRRKIEKILDTKLGERAYSASWKIDFNEKQKKTMDAAEQWLKDHPKKVVS